MLAVRRLALLKDDLARKYISALMARVHALRQPRTEEAVDLKNETGGDRDEQSYTVRLLTWLRDRL